MKRKKKAVIRREFWGRFSNKLIFIICVLIFSLFLVVMVSGEQQNLKGQAQGITPTYNSLGDCNVNGTCPTSGAGPTNAATVSPISQMTQAPCVVMQSQQVDVATSKHRRLSGNSNFFQQLLNLLLQLLQEIMQLLGGNLNNNPPNNNIEPTPIITQPNGNNDNIQPTAAPTMIQIPCSPTPNKNSGTNPTTAPTNSNITPIPTITSGTNPSAAPSGTKKTITAYGWGGSAVYQTAGSPWWALNDAWGGPPPNTQAIDYYPNNFPNNTTIRWSYGGSGGNVLGYPEIIIGDQNDHTIPPPNGVEPAWHGKTLGSISRFVINWDIAIDSQSGNSWDILFENHMNGHEVGIFLRDPGWANVSAGTHFSNLGGISGYGIPGCWASGSFCIVPDGPHSGTPMLKGSVDLLPIFKWAIASGWMSSSYVLDGWEMGIEATNGSGSVTFNSLSVDIQ